MSILLVRHGQAVALTTGDRERFLTQRGRSETLSVGQQLLALGHVPSAIVSSPLVRAVQTAEILAHALGFAGLVTTEPALEPEADPAAALRRVTSGAGVTMIVCHEPIVRGMAALLARQGSFPAFRTSAAVLFDESRVVARVEP